MPAASAGTGTASTTTTTLTVTTPLSPGVLAGTSKALSTKQQVISVFLDYPKVAQWLKRYPPNPTTDATFKDGVWTVHVWSGAAGEIATGTVDDATVGVAEA